MKLIKTYHSSDTITTKCIFKVNESKNEDHVESVFVNYHNKQIICYSTQVGCKGGCKFCYSGIHGEFKRNLTAEELSEQCLYTLEMGKTKHLFSINKPILFSAMGIGDPLDNYENYISHIEELSVRFPGSKFALSTRASNPSDIDCLIDDTRCISDFKLQVSLHTPFEAQRRMLMSTSADLNDIMKACANYIDRTKRNIEFNITLMYDINDSIEHAGEIAHLLQNNFTKDMMQYIKVKINRFNYWDGCEYHGSDMLMINLYINILRQYNINVEFYETDGSDICSACGQLGFNITQKGEN